MGDTINLLFTVTVTDVTKQCSQVQLQKLYLTMLVQSLGCQRCFYHYTLTLESICHICTTTFQSSDVYVL